MYTITINVQYACYSTGLKISIIIIACFAQREEPPWDAEPGFELRPATQKASALPTEPRCTLTEPRCILLTHAAPYFVTLHPICVSSEIYGLPYMKKVTEFREIPRNFTELYITEFAGIPPEVQPIPHGIRNRRK